MAYVMGKNRKEVINKTKAHIRNVMKVSSSKYNIKIIGKPNPRLTIGNEKMYYVSIQKKNKM